VASSTVTDVQSGCADVPRGPVDVLVRPESLRIDAVASGNGIVSNRTFLGSVTRVSVLLSGDVAVQVDVPSASAAALAPGASVQVSLDGSPVQVTERS
jgi:putative spermidine/putrescine transport system ATP-binding protein